jgi:membrane protein DedA with SNARE-associated domain
VRECGADPVYLHHPDIAALIAAHGYWITFIGSLIEGESVLTLAGLAAHRSYLHLPLLIALAAIGSFLGDQAYFLVGRYFGARLLQRYPRFEPAVHRVDALVMRYAGVAVIAVRFLYGFRTVGPIAMGTTRMPWHVFAGWNALGALLWSMAWIMAGYLVGEAVHAIIGDFRHYEGWIFSVVLVIVLALGVILHLRRRPTSAMVPK